MWKPIVSLGYVCVSVCCPSEEDNAPPKRCLSLNKNSSNKLWKTPLEYPRDNQTKTGHYHCSWLFTGAKSTLLNTPYTSTIGCGEMKLVLTMNQFPCWFAFTVLEDAGHASGREKSSTALSRCEPPNVL